MVTSQQFSASCLEDLNPVCQHLATLVRNQKIVLFSGEMGAGKTTLIKQFCNFLGVKDEVSSPTFSLVNEYQSPIGNVYHFDLYRIQSENELYDIGYEHYFFSGYLCLIEWPEMAKGIIPSKHVLVELRLDNNQRLITVTNTK